MFGSTEKMNELSTSGSIRSEVHGAIGHVCISNVRKRNAMSMDMWQSFAQAVETLDSDPAVRVIVVRGDGNEAFVSGADISQFESRRTSLSDQEESDRIAERAYMAPGRAAKPVIAAIRGICYGGGLGLAAACDLRVCSTDARFRMPAARLGLAYSVDGLMRFVSLVGPQNTLDLFMTARVFDGHEALRIGFVAAAVPPETLDAKVDEMAQALSQNAPLTLRAAKLAVKSACSRSSESLAAARDAVRACAASADYLEGQRAFRERRDPVFEGR